MHDGVLAGASALKTPNPGYRKGCFEKAKVSQSEKHFPLKLGYVVVADGLQKLGLAHLLVAAALSARDGKGVYATSKLSNLAMHQVLRTRRFERVGDSYRSKEREVQIVLFALRGK